MTLRLRLGLVAGVIVFLAISAAATRGFGLFRPVSGGDLRLYGNVDIREVDLAFRVPGRIAAMTAEEGTRVAAGARLAELDRRPLADRLAAADARVEAARAQLAKRVAGPRPQEIAAAAAELAQRRATLVAAQADYDRRRPLVSAGAVSQAVFDQTEGAWRAAQAGVQAAEQALSLQRAGSRKEDIDGARADLATAVAEQSAARTDLADSVIEAPSPGVILTRAREPGAIVGAGETVFTLTIDRPVRVRAYVAEPDLGRVRPGLTVTVTADGAPRVYHGVVGYVSPTAEFTPKTVETRSLRADLVYRLRVMVTDADDALRQGQPVTVTLAAGGRRK